MTNYRKVLPSLDYLSECFIYENGKLFWKHRPKEHFKQDCNYRNFNNKHAQKECNFVASHGYRVVTLDGTIYMVHRIIFKLVKGREPGDILDHIDEDKLNNKIENLREVSRAENRIKSSKIYNASGYRGVYKRKDREAFEVRVTNNARKDIPRDVSVGYYKDIEEAATAYDMALEILYENHEDYYKNNVDFDRSLVDTTKTFFKKYGGVPSLG